MAAYPSTAAGCSAIEAVLASGVVPAAIEFLDRGALDAARNAFPVPLPSAARFIVVAEADGTPEEATRAVQDLREVLEPDSVAVWAPERRAEVSALWRWRDGVLVAVAASGGQGERGHRCSPRSAL